MESIRRRWTPTEESILRDMSAADAPVGEIAERVGRTYCAVQRKLRLMGISHRIGEYTESDDRDIVEMLQSGWTIQEIADEMDRWPDSIRHHIKLRGLDARVGRCSRE